MDLTSLARLITTNLDLHEVYSALLGALRLNQSDTCRSILITSTQPSEGKTTIASSLALTAALAGQSVLLIDGDLRQRELAMAAGIRDGVGLTEILEGQADAEGSIRAISPFPTAQPSGPISIIGAGRKSASILPVVDWPRARSAFAAIAERFSIVIIDTPPILAVNDALLLTGIVDGIVLVVDMERADREEVRRAREQLELVGAPLMGVVLNRFNRKLHGLASQPYRSAYLAAQAS